MQPWPGTSYPLGATYDGTGTNFTLFSEVAESVTLCLFDTDGSETAVALPERDGFVWHGYLPGVVPGQRYGYRVDGPFDPARGLRCQASKLLIDPYAKALDGNLGTTIEWDEAVYGYRFDARDEVNDTDSAAHVPKAVVVNPFFDWHDDRPPRTPYHETVIYEAHVKGLTVLHPDVGEEMRGSYSGVAHPAVISHLQRLGVTAIELMPVHQFVHDDALVQRGLRNYWGYNTIAFLAPHNGYAAPGITGTTAPGADVPEFKAMVRDLHAVGIEVILDVVYNHTAEGNHQGPTLSMRGIDNQAYYRLVEDEPRYYMDYTGTGNSLNVRQPHTLQLIMDSLRYWVTEMHVDGFRFDLASTLAREFYDVDRLSTFFDLVQQDPVISQVKLIAEPWDVGPGGYQVGNFPPGWTEWNGKYRDTVRDFWRGTPGTLGEFGSRLTGSSDLYQDDGRRPYASINFVTVHDGFTLTDLVSYDGKHNEANGEGGKDGADNNNSWNHGVEGPTDDEAIRRLRERQRRNFLATLFLSQGVPMLLHGDEMGRTQYGNNNGYCQDSEISWMEWTPEKADSELMAFTGAVSGLRAAHPVFRRRRFFNGSEPGGEQRDIAWFTAAGEEMGDDDWDGRGAPDGSNTVTVFLNGEGIAETDRRGQRVVDDSFLLILNAHHWDVEVTLPGSGDPHRWATVLDTETGDVVVGTTRISTTTTVDALPDGLPEHAGGETVTLTARSTMLLQRRDVPA